MSNREWRPLALVVGMGLAAVSCTKSIRSKVETEIGVRGPHTPAPPPSITDPMDPTQRGVILAYARTLEFADPSRDSAEEYHGQWDRALVDTLGDTAIVEPEVNIHRTDDAELQRGRIQMKIVVLVGRLGRKPGEIYEALGAPPGVSYVWVDSFKMESATRGSARVVVIPEDTSLAPRTRRVKVFRNPDVVWSRAVARWTPFQCWTCTRPGSWCQG
jgi:hypothetical protein